MVQNRCVSMFVFGVVGVLAVGQGSGGGGSSRGGTDISYGIQSCTNNLRVNVPEGRDVEVGGNFTLNPKTGAVSSPQMDRLAGQVEMLMGLVGQVSTLTAVAEEQSTTIAEQSTTLAEQSTTIAEQSNLNTTLWGPNTEVSCEWVETGLGFVVNRMHGVQCEDGMFASGWRCYENAGILGHCAILCCS